MNDIEDTTDLSTLISQIKHPKKLAFLEVYPTKCVSKHTAEAIGITEWTHYNWLRKDTVYNTAFTALKKEIEAHLIEIHEQNIDNVAFSKDTPAQSRIFGSLVRLRAIAPDKYRERPLIDKAIIGDITVKLATPPYNDEVKLIGGNDAIQNNKG